MDFGVSFLGSLQSYRPNARYPPHIAQYPFEIVSKRGVSHPFCLVFMWYRASIAEIPLLWAGVSRGKAQKGGGGIAPNWSC